VGDFTRSLQGRWELQEDTHVPLHRSGPSDGPLYTLALPSLAQAQFTTDWSAGIAAQGVVPALAVDGGRNSVVAATLIGQPVTVHKFGPTGTALWQRSLTGAAGRAFDVITDPTGNIVLGGSVLDATGVPQGTLVAKFDAAGNPLWQDVGTGSAQVRELALDTAGNVYALVQAGASGASDVQLVKLGANGARQWVRSYGATAAWTRWCSTAPDSRWSRAPTAPARPWWRRSMRWATRWPRSTPALGAEPGGRSQRRGLCGGRRHRFRGDQVRPGLQRTLAHHGQHQRCGIARGRRRDRQPGDDRVQLPGSGGGCSRPTGAPSGSARPAPPSGRPTWRSALHQASRPLGWASTDGGGDGPQRRACD
jgi:hypothetical protein